MLSSMTSVPYRALSTPWSFAERPLDVTATTKGARSRRAPDGGDDRGLHEKYGHAKEEGSGWWDVTSASPPERVQCWSGYGPAASSSGEALLLDPSERPPALIGWCHSLGGAILLRRKRYACFSQRPCTGLKSSQNRRA
jgi:hypothetical protein